MMTRPLAFIAGPLLLLGLAACEPVPAGDGAGASRPISVSESIAAIAAPHQDLTRARLRAEDGCFWYTHRGPVETTELPLRTVEGNPICARPQG
jgi:hypothetical protein